jgi:hypothetical protein
VRVVCHIQFERELTTDMLEVWLFDIDIFEGNHRHTFAARTDMKWADFRDQVHARLDAMDVRLNFQVNVDA